MVTDKNIQKLPRPIVKTKALNVASKEMVTVFQNLQVSSSEDSCKGRIRYNSNELMQMNPFKTTKYYVFH